MGIELDIVICEGVRYVDGVIGGCDVDLENCYGGSYLFEVVRKKMKRESLQICLQSPSYELPFHRWL